MAQRRIDVHHHFVPPFYRQALEEGGGDPSGWVIPGWTLEQDIRFNDEENIAFTFLTITAPGAGIVPLGDEQIKFCRKANEYAAGICSSHPERYGFFATIPSLLDPASAQAEIIYAHEKLGADGIILYTRYGQGNYYLGHPDFKSTWDLLESRSIVVFVHPTHPVDTSLVNASLPQPVIDYPHETTRTAVDLITSGTVRSHPHVQIILPHAGGTLPYLALRPAALLPYIPSGAMPATNGVAATKDSVSLATLTNNFIEDAKSFYFDTALSTSPLQLALLKDFAQPGHILFGSDFPYAPTPVIKHMNKLLDEYDERDGDLVHGINMESALKLFPRLSGVLGSS
ncbi:hypothetical protein GGR51DRAFT_510548 [Nemania sp. FL0031]|nr:hypothetical protein GGR51DRAFT_510548 [Nemania sp. FL0031]